MFASEIGYNTNEWGVPLLPVFESQFEQIQSGALMAVNLSDIVFSEKNKASLDSEISRFVLMNRERPGQFIEFVKSPQYQFIASDVGRRVAFIAIEHRGAGVLVF